MPPSYNEPDARFVGIKNTLTTQNTAVNLTGHRILTFFQTNKRTALTSCARAWALTCTYTVCARAVAYFFNSPAEKRLVTDIVVLFEILAFGRKIDRFSAKRNYPKSQNEIYQCSTQNVFNIYIYIYLVWVIHDWYFVRDPQSQNIWGDDVLKYFYFYKMYNKYKILT